MNTEKRTPCPYCHHDDLWIVAWEMFEPINPNGEFVEGYGHSTVLKKTGSKWKCAGCGWQEGGSPVILDRDGNVIGKIG